MFDKVKSIIDQWDPVGLLSMHCPPDEYDNLSLHIAGVALRESNIDALGSEIYNIFIKDFGDDTFYKNIDECRNIAKIILE